MYGTVARLRLRAGAADKLSAELAKRPRPKIPGFALTMLYRTDEDANECYLVVAFKDRKTYLANAHDPLQNERYQRVRALLVEDPEWHDGDILWSERAVILPAALKTSSMG